MVSLNLGPSRGQRIGVRRRRPRAQASSPAAPRAGCEGRARSKTVSLRSLQRQHHTGRTSLAILPDLEAELPASRSECRGGMRPCPFVSCRFHLYLDVNETTGSIKINFPDLEPWELSCSCALDVAEAGGLTLDAVGSLLNLTRERARQVETIALQKIHDVLEE